MSKYTRLLLVILLLFSFSLSFTSMFAKPPAVRLEGTYDLFKTVDHVDLSYRDDLVKVYSDGENDIAYYMYTGERDVLHVGDSVYTPYGEEFTVTSIDCIGFLIKPVNDVTAVQLGFSGMAVLNADGDQLGAISYIVDESIYCIWT